MATSNVNISSRWQHGLDYLTNYNETLSRHHVGSLLADADHVCDACDVQHRRAAQFY